MKILRNLFILAIFILAITALFLAQFVDVASGQDVNGQDAQKPRKNRLPKPPADNSDISLPLFSLDKGRSYPLRVCGRELYSPKSNAPRPST